jgi:single-strand DNA-binding protein
MANINRVVLTGGLTRDPELRQTPAGTVASLRVAFSTRRKLDGAWQEKANYVDVDVWGAQAESATTYLSKGRQVALDGRLEWSEYEARDGSKRQALRIVADRIQFLGQRVVEETDGPVEAGVGAEPGAASARDDEIPF